METTKHKVGGYRFDDYSDLIELYTPDKNMAGNSRSSVNSSCGLTLHVKGRENLEHHFQHYFVPYRKVFIALRANVKMTTNEAMGFFGEHWRWRKGVNLWWETGQSYWENIIHRRHGTSIYICRVRHTSSSENEPGTPGGDAIWEQGQPIYSYDWANGQKYIFNQFVSHDNPVLSGYRCIADHTSVAGVGGNEPGIATTWTNYWDIGDEMQSDLSWPYTSGFVGRVNLSEGKKFQFGTDIIGIFRGWNANYKTNHEGRALDAMAADGGMLAGATLWGVEIDDTEYYHE